MSLGAGELMEGPLGVGLVNPEEHPTLKKLGTARRLRQAHTNAKGVMTSADAFNQTSDALSGASYPRALSSAQFQE